MSTNYGGSNVYQATIPLPSDGDRRNATTLNAALTPIVDRTTYLKAGVDSGVSAADLIRAELRKLRAYNWTRTVIGAGTGMAPVYSSTTPTDGRWSNAAATAGGVIPKVSLNLIEWSGSTTVSGPLTEALVSASNGTVVLFGGTLSGATAQKLIRGTPGGTYTAVSSTDSSTATVTALAWDPYRNLFIAGLSNGKIETSPDGITWTLRYTGSAKIWAFAVASFATVATYAQYAVKSTNGTTWNSSVIDGASDIWQGVAWCQSSSRFYATSDMPKFFWSYDGTTWSTVVGSGIAQFNPSAIKEYNGVLAIIDSTNTTAGICASADFGITWQMVASFPSPDTTPGTLTVGDGRIVGVYVVPASTTGAIFSSPKS